MIRPNYIFLKHKKAAYGSLAGKEGFSLLELLIGLAAAAMGLVVIISVFVTLTRAYSVQNASASLQQLGRAAIDYMTQSIRMAGLNPRRIDNVGVISATSTSIEFNLDRNLNGQIDSSAEEHVAYIYDSAKMKVGEALDGRAPYPLVKNVTELTFTYRDREGNDLGPTPNLERIRTVEILLIVALRSGREQQPVSRTYSSRVICRNLGL
jgi:type II secretory pathway pseudopilin PulG